jgi:hypothetical protein
LHSVAEFDIIHDTKKSSLVRCVPLARSLDLREIHYIILSDIFQYESQSTF